jgi:hypothetical protein
MLVSIRKENVCEQHEPFYGEPINLTDVFPDTFSSDVLDLENETGGEEGEESNSKISRELVIGVIPPEDSHGDKIGVSTEGQELMQGVRQGTPNEVLHWSKPNEEQEVQVYA